MNQPIAAVERMVAYHEAGHAIAALAVGFPVESATIIMDGDTLGSVTFRKSASRPDNLRAAIVHVSGYVASDLSFPGGGWAKRGSEDPDFLSARLSLWCEEYGGEPKVNPETSVQVDLQIAALVASIGPENMAREVSRVWADKAPERAVSVEKRLSSVCRTAAKFLRRVWPQVLAVQRALLESKTLSGLEIEAIAATANRPS